MEYPDWLNGLIIALATVALVGVTIFYARVTQKILKESEQMRLDAQKPNIGISLHLNCELVSGSSYSVFANLVVENIGAGPAYDVTFTTDLSFSIGDGRTLGEVPFFQHGIGYLPPGKKREQELNGALRITYGELKQKQQNITATYKDSIGEKHDSCICIKFREYLRS